MYIFPTYKLEFYFCLVHFLRDKQCISKAPGRKTYLKISVAKQNRIIEETIIRDMVRVRGKEGIMKLPK